MNMLQLWLAFALWLQILFSGSNLYHDRNLTFSKSHIGHIMECIWTDPFVVISLHSDIILKWKLHSDCRVFWGIKVFPTNLNWRLRKL